MVLVLGVTLAVFLLYRWQQKSRLGTGVDGMDLSPSQKLEPPPDNAPEDIQGLHLELGRQQEEDLPLQPPYYDLGMSPIYQPLVAAAVISTWLSPTDREANVVLVCRSQCYTPVWRIVIALGSSCLKDRDVHYAELDTSVLELVPGPQSTVQGPGEAVEYAVIQLSPPEH